jgi:hypothetical protein
MKKVFPEKLMNSVIIVELNVTPLKMVDPISACILDIKRKAFLYCTILHFTCKCTRKSENPYALL